MLYLIDIIKEAERVRDPEGAEFVDLASAQAEAAQSARDLAAEELRCGKPFPVAWKAEVVDRFGNVHATFAFASLLSKDASPFARPIAASPPAFAERFYRAKLVFEQTQQIALSARTTFTEIRRSLAVLG
jgi:hypothetical protein